MSMHSPLLNVMIAAAEKAARGLVRDFGELEQLQSSLQGVERFVAASRLRTATILRDQLLKVRPAFGVVARDSDEMAGDDGEHQWLIEPLSGTLNFARSLPHFALSVAALKGGAAVASLIFDPIADDMFVCEKGGGVFRNQARLRTSARRLPQECVVAVGMSPGKEEDATAKSWLVLLKHVIEQAASVRCGGCATLGLAWTAAGRYDAYWDRGLSRFDAAAGSLMVQEAGGYVVGDGAHSDATAEQSLLASNMPSRRYWQKLLGLDS